MMNNLSKSVSSIAESKNVKTANPVRKRLIIIVAFMGLMVVSGSVMAGGASSLGFVGVGLVHLILMYVYHLILRGSEK